MLTDEMNRAPDELVTFKFGPNAKAFVVRKQFAGRASPTLAAIFDGPQLYTREDIKEDTGRLFVHWIVTKNLDTAWDNYSEHKVLVELWVLGGTLHIPALQNTIIREWYENRESAGDYPFRPTCVHYAYENTPRDSPLRNFLVDLCVTDMD